MVSCLFYPIEVYQTLCRAIMHDPTLYPEPDIFKPERFLGPDGTLLDDPIVTSAFGWGKRICPGRHFVDATMFIVVSSLLSVFNIEKVQDAEGRPFVYSYKGAGIRYSTTIISLFNELITSLAVHTRSHAQLCLGINKQRNLLSQIPWRVRLPQGFPVYVVVSPSWESYKARNLVQNYDFHSSLESTNATKLPTSKVYECGERKK
jgi:hypothetical protein